MTKIFKVSVQVGNRDIVCHAKPGMLATIELGTHSNKNEMPEHKVAIVVGPDGADAWVQVAEYSADKSLRITHEGYTSSSVKPYTTHGAIRANIQPATETSDEMTKCQDDAVFGPEGCCVSYGSGCYVRCCGGCCSDPARCPGASCCP